MNDCLWFPLGVCDGNCKCNKYLSMNKEKGHALQE